MYRNHIFSNGADISLADSDAMDCYASWESPTLIIADGPYGIGGFPGDPRNVSELPGWYAPHIAAWSAHSTPETSLWFWGTELGWATVHPVLDMNGWDYCEAHVWNKDVSHIAGNVNSKTIRSAPVVTEICVRYSRHVLLKGADGERLSIQDWLRSEWMRSGLPFSKANEACGVRNAATRKYFTPDSLWHFPPPRAMEQLSAYANEYGKPDGKPYISLDGKNGTTAEEWSHMRVKWNHSHGITNVWDVPPLHGKERLKESSGKSVHYNQKPEEIISYIIKSSTDPGDVVWDPFSGLATVPVCCASLGRTCRAAEISEGVYGKAAARLADACAAAERRTG